MHLLWISMNALAVTSIVYIKTGDDLTAAATFAVFGFFISIAEMICDKIEKFNS